MKTFSDRVRGCRDFTAAEKVCDLILEDSERYPQISDDRIYAHVAEKAFDPVYDRNLSFLLYDELKARRQIS